MQLKHIFLVCLFFVGFLTGCGGGLSQDDMRRNALSNDDEEEETEPVIATKQKPADEEGASTSKAAVKAVSNAPIPAKAGATPPPGPASPHETVAKNPPPPASKAEKSQAENQTTSSANEGAETFISTGVASTPFDSADDFAAEPNRVNATNGEPPTAEAIAAAEIEALGPEPVTGDEPTSAQLDAKREWRSKRKQIDRKLERALEEREKERILAARRSNKSDSEEPSSANEESGSRNNAQLLQELFARLTDPGQLAPDELARVAQELAYSDATKEAIAYYHGWSLTGETSALKERSVHWAPALQRPVTSIHWGLGIEYSGAPQLVSKAEPIGKGNSAFKRSSRGKNSGKLETYVGELGDRLIIGLEERIERGSQGDLLKPPPESEVRPRTVNLKWQAKPVGFNPEPLGRGMTLLGGGTRKELLHIARLEGIDVLVIYDMNVKQPRSGPVINITTLKLVDVWRDKDLFTSAPLNNVKVKLARQDRSKSDPVEKEFIELFAFVDDSLRFTPLPQALKEEHARARIETLAASQPANPLAAMSEMRLYQLQGLIGDATLYAGYKVLIGDASAKKLLTGTPAERVAAIGQYLPKLEPAKER